MSKKKCIRKKAIYSGPELYIRFSQQALADLKYWRDMYVSAELEDGSELSIKVSIDEEK